MTIAGVWTTGSSFPVQALLKDFPAHPATWRGEPIVCAASSDCFAEDELGFVAADIKLFDRCELAAALGLDPALSDPRLLLGAWRAWGAAAFARIDGEFAAAIWDRPTRTLLLVRDAIGQRPLFCTTLPDGLAFGSEPLPLGALSGATRADMVRVAAYLAWLPDDGSRSFIQGVSRVRPGHFLSVTPNADPAETDWWNPLLNRIDMDAGEAAQAVDAEIRRAVTAILRNETAVVAADLTAGLDSSLIVATAAERPDDRSRLLTMTAVPDGPVDRPPQGIGDESGSAAQTAAMHGVRHMVVPASPESPFAALDRWFPAVQAPIANACNLGWMDACFAAAKAAGAESYLTGGRGNFTVTRPGVTHLAELARSLKLRELAKELRAYRRFARGSWSGLLSLAFGGLIPTRLWNAIAPVNRSRQGPDDIIVAALLRKGATMDTAFAELGAAGAIDAVFLSETGASRLLALRSVDEGSGNHATRLLYGIDLHEPLADRRLVELCLRLPTGTFFRDGRPRALARDLLRGRAPDSVVEGLQRGWQGANWRAGFEPARAEMRAELDKAEADPELSALLDIPRMRHLLAVWPEANWKDWEQIEVYRHTLFRAIGAARFVRFVREWPDGAGAA